MLKPCGVTLEQLDREQIVTATRPGQYRKYVERGFRTPSGKLEFYSAAFESKGQSPLPAYSEPLGEPIDPAALAERGYPLLASSTRLGQFVHTTLKHTEALGKPYPDPMVRMHPDDAAARCIEDGDLVEARSPVGKITLTAETTEDTPPGLVWIDFGWGNPTDGKANINVPGPGRTGRPGFGRHLQPAFSLRGRKSVIFW